MPRGFIGPVDNDGSISGYARNLLYEALTSGSRGNPHPVRNAWHMATQAIPGLIADQLGMSEQSPLTLLRKTHHPVLEQARPYTGGLAPDDTRFETTLYSWSPTAPIQSPTPALAAVRHMDRERGLANKPPVDTPENRALMHALYWEF